MKDAQLVLELWELLKDFLPAKNKPELAESFLKLFEDYGFDIDEIYEEIGEEDKNLEKAFNNIRSDYSEVESYYDDSDGE